MFPQVPLTDRPQQPTGQYCSFRKRAQHLRNQLLPAQCLQNCYRFRRGSRLRAHGRGILRRILLRVVLPKESWMPIHSCKPNAEKKPEQKKHNAGKLPRVDAGERSKKEVLLGMICLTTCFPINTIISPLGSISHQEDLSQSFSRKWWSLWIWNNKCQTITFLILQEDCK